MLFLLHPVDRLHPLHYKLLILKGMRCLLKMLGGESTNSTLH